MSNVTAGLLILQVLLGIALGVTFLFALLRDLHR